MADITPLEVDASLARLYARVEARFAQTDLSATTGLSVLREQFTQLRAEIRADMRVQLAEMRIEMYKSTAELIVWGFFFVLAAVILTVILLS